MVSVNIQNAANLRTFEEIGIGKLFVRGDELFVKVGEELDPVVAIALETGDVWEVDGHEKVQIPTNVDIEVEL